MAPEDDKAEADAAVSTLAALCLTTATATATTGEGDEEEGGARRTPQEARDFYEAALAVCGPHPAARPLWEAYEAAERAAGQHQRAHGVRWRALQALEQQQQQQQQ
jgi:hypothetical protein